MIADRRPVGRPPYKPTDKDRRTVKAMAAFGVPEDDIAETLGIDAKTLRKHLWQELRLGHVQANARVAESLFRKATGDGREAVVAAIFWLKCRAGWRDRPAGEHEIGKKEEAAVRARSAERGTDWEKLLN